jgi:asparagine synthase (glutamine-hydrolysing)
MTSELISMGLTRLSIFKSKVNLASINAPDQSVIVLLNGEVWNFNDLADEFGPECISSEYDLIRCGYLSHGIDYISRLDGVFFIAIIDRPRNTAFFARDPMGIKPAFYYFDAAQRTFSASSDLKTICDLPEFHPQLNADYLHNHSVFHFSDYDESVLVGIRQIPPHHYVRVDLRQGGAGGFSVSRFQSMFLRTASSPTHSLDEQLALLEKAILKRYNHTESYPVGLLLSGGIDSSLLAFISKRLGLEQIVCFFFGTQKSEDYTWARKVSEITGYRLEHIQPCASKIIHGLPEYCHELSGDTGFIASYLSHQMKMLYPHMKVVLCGEGSDELYGGYTCYTNPLEYFRRLSHRMKALRRETALVAKTKAMITKAHDHQSATKYLFEFNLEEQLVNNHLVPLDHGFMANSLELRLPFLDLRNVNFVRSMPLHHKISGRRQKVILKDLLAMVFNMSDAEFLERKKLGLPSAVPLSAVNVEDYAEALIPTTWGETHPYRPLFNSHFEMMWFDLVCLIFIRSRGQAPKDFCMHALYCPDNLSALKGYLGA